ncbi:hypothetical protein NK214_16385 [Chromobacterium sp. S0633]|uniref:hypothetical protein n=1 Tax=Chromobacterium sp. S0633 TaxID=2957805 RepID=UPI00209E6D89|nr:hypothetical protein [Chromobacterium sp. S0633]MCP1291774.1 hypothetical protein [Chromobacterium sp. S0633]
MKRNIFIILLCALWLLAFVAFQGQLISIPRAWALNMPDGLYCESYSAVRNGWVCSKFESVLMRSWIGLLALIGGGLAFKLMGRVSGMHFSVLYCFLIFVELGAFFAGLRGYSYFWNEHASAVYGNMMLILLVLSGVGMVWTLLVGEYKSYLRGRKVKARQALGIDIEIAERLVEKKSREKE